MRKNKSIQVLLLISGGILLLAGILISIKTFADKEDGPPISIIEPLQKYLNKRLQEYRNAKEVPPSYLPLRDTLQNAYNGLNIDEPVYNFGRRGAYYSDNRWTFLQPQNPKEFFGIFYGENYKIIFVLEKKDNEWIILYDQIIRLKKLDSSNIENNKERTTAKE